MCCADGIHCCPEGCTCDLSRGTCESLYGGSSILMISKRPPTTATVSAVVNAPPPIIKKQHQTVTANEPQNVMCNDKKTQCADGDTCCMLSPRKEYGCCPMTNATCCSDGVHCCPSKYTCNVSGQICSKGSITVPLVEKVQLGVHMATSTAPQNDVICPNKETECSAGSTCCKLKSEQYACCPIADALCCSDGEHCCPKTYTCNTKDETCIKGSHVIAMFTKQPAIKKAKQLSTLPLEAPKNIICPDQESQCASNATCCLLKSGVYGCCPIPFAVCCKDGLHCCPNDYACQEGTGKCTDRGSSMAAFKKRPALRREEKSGALITPAKMANNKPSLSSIVDKSQVVTCSDGASICPDGFTCCRNASGGFGCCPHVSAVCCDDDKHCCPEDYTCDQSGSCLSLNGDSILPLSKKVPATTRGSQKKLLAAVADQNIVIPLLKLKKKQVSATAQNKYCPDGGQCLSTQTCCKLDSVEYGCCPYLAGECCSDDKHCCPAGHYCYYDECLSFSSSLPVMNKQPLRKTSSPSNTSTSQAKIGTLLLSSNVIICPNQKDECSDSSTCCPVSSGGYGCCPVKDAICCNDGSHCCPQGYSCNTETGTCSMGSSIVSMLERSNNLRQKTIVSERVSSVVCPDNRSECPSGSTCCRHPYDSRYGCCPLVHAQCCTDGKHCCPIDFKCDVANEKCTKGDEVVRIFTKQPALIKSDQATIKTLKNNVCPDEKSECPNQSTCCKLTSGNFACCPMENAVCCQDGKHCCPSSYSCATDGTCTKGKDTAVRVLLTELSPPPQPPSPPYPPFPSSINEPQSYFRCPDQTTFYCRTGQTCCRNSTGGWECCNSALAVCCSEFNSCCPQGNKCPKDANSNCIPNVASRYPFLKPKSSAFRATKHFSGPVKTEGLVPPTVKQPTIIASFKTEPAFVPKVPQNVNNVVCPDRRSECSSNATCCLLKSGGYGCCPLPNALCCRDQVHCCPEGYECKTGEGNCIKGDKVIAMFKKQPAIIKKTQNIVCPDERSECDNKSTCCLLGLGTYGCCPVINAQCCDDKIHCCPSGYLCKNDGSGACVKGDRVAPLLKKQPAIATIKKSQNIVCPDGQSECDINSTCCLLASGTYGCCPVPRAQCCEDRTHCCPEDYKCETSTCTQGDQVVAMLKKQPAILKRTTSLQRSSVVFCKDKTTCPDKSTCCKLKSGQYGCCPQLNGVCCSDGVHCCPAGFTCDLNKGTCTKGDRIAVPFLAKLAVATPKRVIKSDKIVSPSLVKLPVATVELPEGVIKCPDNGYCPDTSTCCLLESGRYGCCPQVKATCCSDKEHCCPQNYKCQFKSNTCTKGTAVVPMLKKLPSFSSPQDAIVQKEEKEPLLISKSQTVVCPDQRSECPTDSTCCLTAGTYRCCPGMNSVCCGDRIHCCPEGYTCHVPTKTCTKGDTVVSMLKKSPPSSLRSLDKAQDVSKKLAPPPSSVHADSPQNVICPNHDSQCPDQNTCCQGDGKYYNCCPTPDAVCCPDKKHCCPKEYTCNELKKSCDNVERGVAIPFMEIAGRAATKDDIVDMTRDVL